MRLKIIILILLVFPAFPTCPAQKGQKKITISGIVTDRDLKPVEDALILIDNQKTDCITDVKGYYKVKASPGATLVTAFSLAKGMSEVPINGRTVINIRLMGSSQAGNEPKKPGSGSEQVNVGYGTVEKRDLTTTVAKIDGQNKKYASYTSIYDMIKGEVPGVQVTGRNITIQGISSFNSSTAPLLVVDGMVVESIDDIRPQHVKSIEILKGAAASIYGSRGTNGVILINLLGAEKKR